MVRAVALEFAEDIRTHNISDEFLFGPSLLVCPVTEPMYYDVDSRKISGAKKTREVYLPQSSGWIDFWSNEVYDGGQAVVADATLERIPVFVRAGSIVPMTEPVQFVDESPDAAYELRVYTGANGGFALYEDAGDGYAYERGECARLSIEWNEDARELVMHARQGSFHGMLEEREYRIVFISADGVRQHSLLYKGEEVRLRLEGANIES